jgi:hypothetical protein
MNYSNEVKIKCIVKDCENHTHEGGFEGTLCLPCHEFITTGNGVYSQVYRNTIKAEREACLKLFESYETFGEDYDSYYADKYAEMIRARG